MILKFIFCAFLLFSFSAFADFQDFFRSEKWHEISREDLLKYFKDHQDSFSNFKEGQVFETNAINRNSQSGCNRDFIEKTTILIANNYKRKYYVMIEGHYKNPENDSDLKLCPKDPYEAIGLKGKQSWVQLKDFESVDWESMVKSWDEKERYYLSESGLLTFEDKKSVMDLSLPFPFAQIYLNYDSGEEVLIKRLPNANLEDFYPQLLQEKIYYQFPWGNEGDKLVPLDITFNEVYDAILK